MSAARAQIRGASEQVAVQIQHYIQHEGLGPDDFLGREEDLADQFGVSRPTLREALRTEASADGDHDALVRADEAVHRTIAAAAGNRMVQALTGWVLEVLQPRLVELLRDAVVHSAVAAQHEALLAALEKGDAARAERAMKDHLLYLRDLLRIVHDGRPG